MAYHIELFEPAEIELDEAIDWYANQSPENIAQNFLEDYLKLIDRISKTPLQFPITKKGKYEVRKAKFPAPFPYNIFFFLAGGTIFIISVFHEKRDPNVWKTRI